MYFFFFSSRRRHTRWPRDWSSDVCSSDLWLYWAENSHANKLPIRASAKDIATATNPAHHQMPRIRPHLCWASEIGRASCRERGWITAVVGAVKKQLHT